MVEPRFRSLAILIAARERQYAYVWAAQINGARRAGLVELTAAACYYAVLRGITSAFEVPAPTAVTRCRLKRKIAEQCKEPKFVIGRACTYASTISNSLLLAPQSGQFQSSGTSAQRVPAGIPSSEPCLHRMR